MKKMKIKISPLVWMMGAALVFFHDSTATEICTILSAAIIHELGHIASAYLLKIRIKCIALDIFGATMQVDSLLHSYKKEAILCLAGPLSNILSVLLVNAFSLPVDIRLFTVASLAFAIINLLPAKGFDGGRVLSCLLLTFISPRAVSVITGVSSFICVFLLWSASVYFIMRTGSYVSLFIFSGALFAKLFLTEEIFEE